MSGYDNQMNLYDQMNILALDTCTECCSAALLYDGKYFQLNELTQRGHSDMILGMMDQLFNQAATTIEQIDAIAFGRGPGSFTGLRVGVGVAQGIAFARNLPVIPVSTLAAVAQSAADELNLSRLAVAMDARMGEIYCASFVVEQGLVKSIEAEDVCAPEAFTPADADNWAGVGTGWDSYEKPLQSNFEGKLASVYAQRFPQADAIIKLALREVEQGNMVPAEQAMPVYLRNNVAKKKGEQ